ncbi:MAG: tetratricopeptide repeat protein [Candidatus Aminicenantes bacterium]|nr:tetratricopeptide repeat protein [Candidatus Aminicenantes bacterium]
MRSNRFLICVFIVVTVFLSNGFSQQSAEQLFQAGIYQEEVGGDLEKAISIYEQIIKEFPNNRETAAKAQLQIGLCYEKLGLEGALKAYKEVISNYGDQKDVVAKAKIRLSKLEQLFATSQEPEGIKIKQIWQKPYQDFLGTVSSDGRFHAYADWGKGDLAIYDIKTGENRLLTHEATYEDPQKFVIGSAISKNGKYVAYSWWTPKSQDLYLVDVDNPAPRLIFGQEEGEIYPTAWLSDKELIVGNFNTKIMSSQIILLNISNGAKRILKTNNDVLGWQRLSCSPDERFIAYDVVNKTNKENVHSDINIFEVDGGSEISLVNHPANDHVLGWVPGRKEFLFISDRSGSWDLWAIPVYAGKPSGPAQRIYTDIGDVSPVGYAQNGDCFFGFSRRNFNASLVPLNSETGELDVASGKSLLGSTYWMKWSPDGQYLIRGGSIVNLQTGEERKYGESMSRIMSPRWSPDEKSILIVGIEKNKAISNSYKGGIYTIDVKTDQTTEILLLADYKYNMPGDSAFPLSEVCWSVDGKSIFYLFFKDRLVKHDLETGEDKILYKEAHFDRGSLARSPDGKWLLFSAKSPEEKKSRLFTLSVDGGQEKELCTSQEADDFYGTLWSPDGKYVYFGERLDGTNL